MTPYHFAVLRYVHEASGEEFVNIGVAMFLPDEGRFTFRLSDRTARINAFFKNADTASFGRMARILAVHLDDVSAGVSKASSPDTITGLLDYAVPRDASSFRWSTAMGGVTDDPDLRLEQLFEEFVLRHLPSASKGVTRDQTLRRSISQRLTKLGALQTQLDFQVEVAGKHATYDFLVGWQNGQLNVADAIALDYDEPDRVIDKALRWSGRLLDLSKSAGDFNFHGVVSEPSKPSSKEAFATAMQILQDSPRVSSLVRQDEIDSKLVKRIAADLTSHS